MRYYFEKYYPLAISALLTFGSAYSKIFGDDMPTLINQLADNALSISVTLFGFLLTILTLVNSIDTRRMRFVRDMGGFSRLITYLRVAIFSNLALLAASFLVKYIEHRTGFDHLSVKGCNMPDYLFVFLFIFSILTSLRFTHIFISLLTDKKNSDK